MLQKPPPILYNIPSPVQNRLCKIGCKDYIFTSGPSAVPDFPDTIDMMLSSAKISSSTSDGIGLPYVYPGTFSFMTLETIFASFTFESIICFINAAFL